MWFQGSITSKDFTQGSKPGQYYLKLVWSFRAFSNKPQLFHPYERPVKRNFQKSFVFLCL